MERPHLLEDRVKHLEEHSLEFQRRLQALTQRVFSIEQRLAGLTAESDKVSPPQQPLLQAQATPPPLTRSLTPAVGQPSSKPPLPADSWETRIGGSWLSKIAVTAIFLGMVFLLKYAIDNAYIGAMGRVVLGVILGIGFLVWAEHLQKKVYLASALALSGGGLAILYLSIFAAFSLYGLIGQVPALLIMMLITATAALLALVHDSAVIAVFGVVGGFLTPILLGTGIDNQIGLFSYLTLLNLGILSLAFYKNWRGLNLLALVLTQFMFLAWASQFYDPSKLWVTEAFLTLFFIIFAVTAVLHYLIHQRRTNYRDLSLITLNGAAYFLWSYALLRRDYLDYLGFFSIGVALLYVGFSRLARRYSPQDHYLRLILLGLALTFLTLAIPIQLEQRWITLGWATEAVVLTWVGFRVASDNTRRAALLIATLVVVRLLFDVQPAEAVRPLVNSRFVLSLCCIAAVFFMAALYSRNRGRLSTMEMKLVALLTVLGNFLLLFLLSTEAAHFFQQKQRLAEDALSRRGLRDQQQLAISTLWASYSIVLVVVGMVKRYRPIRLMAMAVFGLTIVKVFLVDLGEMDKIYRIIASLGLGVILLAVSLIYQKYRQQLSQLIPK